MRRLGYGAVQPAPGLVAAAQLHAAAGYVAHGGAALVAPGGPRQREMPLQRGYRVLPAAVEVVFAAQVVEVAVVLGIFEHGELEQREVLRARFRVVRAVVELHALDVDLASLLPRAYPGQHLVDGVRPLVAVPGVRLLRPEDEALAAVGVEVPGVAVGGAAGAGRPGGLQKRAPAGMQQLVKVGADADIRVLGHQLQRTVARRVEAPGAYALNLHRRAQGAQAFSRAVLGAGVQDVDSVGLAHGIHPAPREFALVFADGIDVYLHVIASPIK